MITVVRYRVHNAVLGVMTYRKREGDGRMLYTVERPWDNNAPGSALPNGPYQLEKATFATRGECYGFVGPLDDGEYKDSVGLWQVPENDRFACLIHSANWPSQLAGCVALGLRPAADADEWGVGDSRKAVNIFMRDHAGLDTLEILLKGEF